MITDNLVVNGLIKVTSQAEVNTLTVNQVNDTSGEDIAQLQGATSNVQEQINALATSYDESIDNSTEFKTGVANAVNSLSDESNLTTASTLAEVLDTIGTVETKNYQKRRLLNSSDDLNNVTKNGFYDILGTSQPINIPSGTSGANAMLEVFDLPDMNITCQVYHKFDLIFGMDTYIRRCESGTWTSWIHNYGTGTATTPGVTKLYTGTGSNTDGTMTQKAILSALNLKSDCKLLTNENLDSVTSPGFYNAGGGNTVSNKPSGVDHFGLIVIHRASGKYYTQIIFNDTSSYRRFCVNGTWGSWAQDKLTDTTYSAATQSSNGLMISSDKKKLDFTNVVYGTCSTDAATAAKVVTISGNTSWVLQKGAIIIVKFSATNTASSVTLNVNGTGAKSIWYSSAVYTGTSSAICGTANRNFTYVYDGTYWVWLSGGADANTTYSPATLGSGYGTCSTDAATAAKVVTLSNYALVTGGFVSVKFTYAVPASATMNINGKGAKAIYYAGAAITAGIISAGDTATFIYNGSQYHLVSIDRSAIGVKGNAESAYRHGNVNITPANIGALSTSGGTVTGTISSSLATNTYLAGNKGSAIINSTAGAGTYVMLSKMNSTNGYFTQGVYNGNYHLQYTAKSTVDAGTNGVTKSVTLLDESGNSSFPGELNVAGCINVAYPQAIRVRHVDGSNNGELYLNYNNPTQKVHIGNAGYGFTSNGSIYNGYTYRNYLPRVAKSCAYQPGASTGIWEEFTAGDSYSLPTNAWYHIFTGQGADANYNTQLALGMTTTNIAYRNRDAGTWGPWQTVLTSGNYKSYLGSADCLTGFAYRTTSSPWGSSTGTHVTGFHIEGCEIAFMKNNPSSGKLSAKIDGYFYQNEGQYRVLDTTDYDTLKSNFQAGVDSIYNAIVAQGTTPASKSLSDVTAGIAKLGSSRYRCVSWSYIHNANSSASSSATEYFNLVTSSSWLQVCSSSENSWYKTTRSELAGKLSSDSFAVCRISGYGSNSGIRRGNGYSSGTTTASYRYLHDITIIANNYTTSNISMGHGTNSVTFLSGLYGRWYDCNLTEDSSSTHKSQDVWFNIDQAFGGVQVTFGYSGARTLWLRGNIKFEFWVFYK